MAHPSRTVESHTDTEAATVTLLATTWVSGFEKHPSPNGDGGPYTDVSHVKLCWHTSETDPGTVDAIAAEQATKSHTDVYHVLADPKLRRVVQVLPLNLAASALAHPPACETNHDGVIQVCIIGRAHDMPNLSADDLKWLGTAVVAPIVRNVPELKHLVVANFYGDTSGFVIASANALQRMSPNTWLNFAGQVGHQHVPGNDHWDPGALNVRAVSLYAEQVLNPAATVPTVIAKDSPTGRTMIQVGSRNLFGVYSGHQVKNGAPVYGYSGLRRVFKLGGITTLPLHSLWVRAVDKANIV